MDKKQMLDKIKEIIGEVELTRHGNRTNPVMIGDVLDWLSKNHKNYYDTQMIILRERSHYTKPINEQSDECIKFVYDLLPTK